jgi:hypothetical protein
MIDFIMAVLLGFILGCLLMRFMYRKVAAMMSAGEWERHIKAIAENDLVVRQLKDLIAESDGVAGLHLNGDIADWDWLIENGWLSSLEE